MSAVPYTSGFLFRFAVFLESLLTGENISYVHSCSHNVPYNDMPLENNSKLCVFSRYIVFTDINYFRQNPES